MTLPAHRYSHLTAALRDGLIVGKGLPSPGSRTLRPQYVEPDPLPPCEACGELGHRCTEEPAEWRAGTPLQRTLRRAHGAVGAQEPSSRVRTTGVDESRKKTQPASQSAGSYAFDIDGVISAFPAQCGSMMSALTAAGFHVYVVSGVGGDTVTDDDVTAKRQFLTNLGVGPDTYFDLAVVPEPHDVNKAKFIEDNHIDVLVDNSKSNVRAASPYCVSLLLWNAREK